MILIIQIFNNINIVYNNILICYTYNFWNIPMISKGTFEEKRDAFLEMVFC